MCSNLWRPSVSNHPTPETPRFKTYEIGESGPERDLLCIFPLLLPSLAGEDLGATVVTAFAMIPDDALVEVDINVVAGYPD